MIITTLPDHTQPPTALALATSNYQLRSSTRLPDLDSATRISSICMGLRSHFSTQCQPIQRRLANDDELLLCHTPGHVRVYGYADSHPQRAGQGSSLILFIFSWLFLSVDLFNNSILSVPYFHITQLVLDSLLNVLYLLIMPSVQFSLYKLSSNVLQHCFDPNNELSNILAKLLLFLMGLYFNLTNFTSNFADIVI